MDSLTQVVLGASVGEAVLGKKIGNKAALWGAIAGTIPDLDVIPGHFMNIVERNDFHRGFSHSLLFFVIASPVLAWILRKIYPKENASFKEWTLLFFLGLLTHSLLDCFTTWGTQLFWPSEARIAFKSIFVIDPLYTLPFMTLLIVALTKPKTSVTRKLLNYIGLGLSSLYLALTLINKDIINTKFQQAFKEQNIEALRFETKPSPLNNILWTGTAETNEGYYIGYYSILDSSKINFNFYPKNEVLIGPLMQYEKIHQILKICEGYFTVQTNAKGLVINDLRFGTIQAWEEGDDFVFAYQITFDNNGELLIEEVKHKMDDGLTIVSKLWNRMMGW